MVGRRVFSRMTRANTSGGRGALLYNPRFHVAPLSRATPHSERANKWETACYTASHSWRQLLAGNVRSARVDFKQCREAAWIQSP